MRLPSALVLFTLVAAPARAQWEPVPLPASFETPSQVALFGFAQGFGDALFVSTGFGIPETPASIVYDLVFVTRDGGASWATVPEFTVDAATGGVKTGRPTVADGVLYLPRARATSTPPTETSTVLRTGDGLTWTAPAAAGLDPNDGVLLNVARQDGVLVGRSERAGGTNDVGYVYRSADDGATWARAGGTVPPRLTYSAGSVLLRGSLGTEGGERSADGGVTWTPHGAQIYSAARSADGVALAGGLFQMLRSTDGGATWARVTSPPFDFGGTLAVTACGTTFVALGLGTAVRSDDGGLTWAPWAEGLGDGNVQQFSCSAGGPAALGGGPAYVYAAVYGDGAGVYRRDLSQLPVASEAAPGAVGPALAVGPNPAARAATLRVTLAAPQTVRVSVSDVLGREVLAFDRALGAGAHALPLDMSGLAPGVYVARLSAPVSSVSSVRFTVAR